MFKKTGTKKVDPKASKAHEKKEGKKVETREKKFGKEFK